MLANLSRDWWKEYARNFHAFWQDLYSKQTKFASDPTSKSSIIGIDFYLLGQQGEEEFGPYGELFPLSDPKGSGFMKCILRRRGRGVLSTDQLFTQLCTFS